MGIRRRLRQGMGGLALGALSACSYSIVTKVPEGATPETITEGCCQVVETYPRSVIALIEPKAEGAHGATGDHRFRTSFLDAWPETWPFITRHLRPMDILTTSDKARLNGRLLPGYFTHSLVYLGTEAQLRAEGLWDLPALRPHHDRIRAGAYFYESVPGVVGFASEAEVYDVDSVAVFRPALSQAEKRAGLRQLIARFGTPFDMHMNSDCNAALYCAELLDRSFPTLNFPKGQAYRRTVLPPDWIALYALKEGTPLDFIGFVYARPDRVVSATATTLAATVRRHAPGD